jgi:hypothetical protein
LRFLQKIREAELLEPLIPTVRSCLEHRHSFVRKNAVFAVYTIFQDHEHLIPDAPELLDTFLAAVSRHMGTELIIRNPTRLANETLSSRYAPSPNQQLFATSSTTLTRFRAWTSSCRWL